MRGVDKEKVAKWFLDNFQKHTDWTGSYIEYNQPCDNVKTLIDKFFTDMENNEN